MEQLHPPVSKNKSSVSERAMFDGLLSSPSLRNGLRGLAQSKRYRKCDYYYIMELYDQKKKQEVGKGQDYTIGQFLKDATDARIIHLDFRYKTTHLNKQWEDYQRNVDDRRKLKPNDKRMKFCKRTTTAKKRQLDTGAKQKTRKKFSRLTPYHFALEKDEFDQLNKIGKMDRVEIYATKGNTTDKLVGIRAIGPLHKHDKIRLGGELRKGPTPEDAHTDSSIEVLQDGTPGYIKYTPDNPKMHGSYRRHVKEEEAAAHADKVNAMMFEHSYLFL